MGRTVWRLPNYPQGASTALTPTVDVPDQRSPLNLLSHGPAIVRMGRKGFCPTTENKAVHQHGVSLTFRCMSPYCAISSSCLFFCLYPGALPPIARRKFCELCDLISSGCLFATLTEQQYHEPAERRQSRLLHFALCIYVVTNKPYMAPTLHGNR